MRNFAVIPTHNRHEELARLVTYLRTEDVTVVVIDNASQPRVFDTLPTFTELLVIRDDEQPPNLSRLWNVGFDAVRELCSQESAWNVGVFNDDTVLPPGWWRYVETGLRYDERHPVLACTDAYDQGTHVFRTEPGGDITRRMCPWAFMVRGEAGLRADEELRWWWGDTDLEWRATRAGGILILPGYTAANTCANSTTVGVLAEQAGRDRETFRRKWGSNPW